MNINKEVKILSPSERNIKVVMIMDKCIKNSAYSLDDNYSFEYYKDGDREAWAKIQFAAGQFQSVKAACDAFDAEFGNNLELLNERLLFVLDKKGNKIGTTMMWFMEGYQKNVLRLHWVAVVPKHQGKKLAHAMIKEILEKYQSTERIYLTTQVKNYIAISIYYKFGFIPYPFADISRFPYLSLEKIKNANFENDQLKTAWSLIKLKISERESIIYY